MERPVWTQSVQPPEPQGQAAPGSLRDRLAVLLALVTIVCVALAFILAKDTQFLMPGPLASAHGAIENCSACHTKSGSGKLSWVRGLVAGDPLADSEACLTCHKMPDTAFNAHGASDEVLEQSTKRLAKIAAGTPVPQSARAQNIAFPTHDKVANGLYCATCHQEHQGINFNLNKITNEQCRSCHVVKFDSFDGHHPKFGSYPFKRRTRIIYDHAGHFGKHFPEVAQKKGLARRIPTTCSTCHDSRKDKKVMAVAPFEQTCTACHLDQITGKERVSGPKGIAFLTLPGLDLQTLKERKASIGEWPDASEAELTPFMKMMISRNERGRALIRIVTGLNLQDLSGASDDQIKAVADLVWEIKRLFYALIMGKASDVLADLNIACGARLSANLVADLTASIPRDVIISAYQQWLPNLGTEMANRQDTSDQEQSCWITTMGGWVTTLTEPRLGADGEAASTSKPGRLAQANQQTQTKNAPSAVAAKTVAALPAGVTGKTDAANVRSEDSKEALPAAERPQNRAADQTDDLLNPTQEELGGTVASTRDAEKAAEPAARKTQPEAAGAKSPVANAKPDSGTRTATADERSQNRAADQTDDLLNPTEEERGGAAPNKDAEKAVRPEGVARRSDTANARPDDGAKTAAVAERPQNRAADQTDDLLNPAEEERGGAAADRDAERAGQPEAAAGKTAATSPRPDITISAETGSKADANTSREAPAARAVPVISIESNVDPESWAEYGGWYRQDYAVFYRPTGHKDKFIYSWLFLTGPQAPKGDTSPAAAVFAFLTSKDAQGACTKCHSVDDIQGKGRVVNFSPPSAGSKLGRFTNFIHEPHFGILENRGCLTCHNLEKGRPYLQSYERGNPKNFVSNFGAVKKDLCQTCHTSGMARQDCLLCHKYHVNGVVTPIMSTRIPTE
jgi:hypothetical protein